MTTIPAVVHAWSSRVVVGILKALLTGMSRVVFVVGWMIENRFMTCWNGSPENGQGLLTGCHGEDSTTTAYGAVPRLPHVDMMP